MSFYWSYDESPEQDRVATPDEAVREWAYNCGGDACRITSQWLLHDFDVWVRNPHYTGPAQRHPEDYDCEDEAREGEPQAPSPWPRNRIRSVHFSRHRGNPRAAAVNQGRSSLMADKPRSLDALRRAAYKMHADHEHDMATDPEYAAVVCRIGRSRALRSEDYQRAVQIVHANEHNTYSDQSGMSTTEAADLTADLARGASGDA